MVIGFTEQAGALRGLELHGRIVLYCGKNCVLHKQSCKIKSLGSYVQLSPL